MSYAYYTVRFTLIKTVMATSIADAQTQADKWAASIDASSAEDTCLEVDEPIEDEQENP